MNYLNIKNRENFLSVKYDNIDVDWSKMAEPQPDSSDVADINKVAEILFDYKKPSFPNQKQLLDGKVAIFHTSNQYGGSVKILGPKSKYAFHLDEINDNFLKLSPKYYNSVREQLDVFVPTYNYTAKEKAGLGCTCGPVCSAYQNSVEGVNIPAIGVSSTVNNYISAMDGITHETFHQRLYQIGVEMEESNLQLIGNDPNELYNSTIRFDVKRPMTACVQAIYSYVAVTEMYADITRYCLENKEEMKKWGLGALLSTSAYNVLRIYRGRDLMNNDLVTKTNAGAAYFDGFYKYLDRVINETVELMEPYKKEFNLKWK